MPPGEYFIKVLYRDGKEEIFYGPCKPTPGCKLFGPSPEIDKVARDLSSFRKGNRIPRSEYVECIEDIDVYTCTRLKGMSEWCIDTDRPFGEVNPSAVAAAAPCATCGHTLQNP